MSGNSWGIETSKNKISAVVQFRGKDGHKKMVTLRLPWWLRQ